MKYIRTKDGIISKEKGVELAKEKFGIIFYTEERATNYLNQFKQADTIEELCDEFVQINKSKDKDLVRIKKIDGVIYYQKLERVFDSEWHRLSAGEYIIGAIWTDKGLIYVAKMNDKGELELI